MPLRPTDLLPVVNPLPFPSNYMHWCIANISLGILPMNCCMQQTHRFVTPSDVLGSLYAPGAGVLSLGGTNLYRPGQTSSHFIYVSFEACTQPLTKIQMVPSLVGQHLDQNGHQTDWWCCICRDQEQPGVTTKINGVYDIVQSQWVFTQWNSPSLFPAVRPVHGNEEAVDKLRHWQKFKWTSAIPPTQDCLHYNNR